MTQLLRSAGRLWFLVAALLCAQGSSAQVVISQVYGGGGNTGATYTNDFIELFNRGTTAVNVTGWTVQYASAAGTTWATTTLTGTLQPGKYYLVQEAAGTGGTTALPTPDVVGTLNLSGTAGKVALVNVTTALSGTCPTGTTLVDFVGFGTTANCFEGTGPTPAPSNTTAVLRASNGCTDTNQNATDFATGAPNPRNSASPANSCGSVTPVAALSVNPNSLTGFLATQGMVSNVQTYTVSGSNLDGTPVSVSATANVELSTTAGGTFTPTLSLPASASSVSQTVYVRLTSAAPTGAFSGTITNTANGTLTASVTVSGQVNAVNAPTLSASPTTLSSFSTSQGTVSTAQTFTVSGSNLSPSSFTATAPSGFEISLDPVTAYTNRFSINGVSNTFNLPVYVRLTNTAAVGPVSGSIVITGSNNTSATVAVSGTVSSTAPAGAYTPIATARAGINSTFTIAGRVTVSNQLGARQIYIQDATGGIAVYSGPSGPDFSTLVNIGDSVQVRGPVTVFSGYLELTGTGNFTVVAGAGSRVPTPIAITPDQLANYQGRLVSVSNATLIPVAATFTGGTNYTITAGGTSGILRISTNSPLAGAGQPANPVSVTGIADRFVSGATTTGNDALQLQPRVLTDIPGSTPATDLTCTIGSGSPLTRDQTLDIAAWNFEFFGADAGVISCPDGKTLAYANFGPTNEALQQTNATQVLTKLNADIISAEEISDINRFDAAVKAMPGSYSYICSNRYSYYFQDECAQVPSGNPPVVFGPNRLAQKVCVIYNTATVTPVLAETKALLDGKYNYPSANNWSSGRLPFLFVANVTIAGITQKVHVVALHAKSGSATADYNRRKQDIIDLKAELDANYATANVIILGDYNDKLNGSIAAGQPSSYQPLVTDAANYSAITLPLENQGCSTFNSSASFIDHIITSNELAKAYVNNTAYVLQPFSIPNYGNTSSDHNPIEARFDLSQLAATTTALSLSVAANPVTLLTTGTTMLSATVSGGTAGSPDRPYSYTFSGPGSITATGNTATVSNLPAGVQTFTVVARDATQPTSQTLSATVSVTVSAPAPTGPATLTITSFNCFSTNGALSRVNFVVGYSNGTFVPALPPLFINGVTDNGMLGQPYNFGFDANASTLSVQNNANRASTYFVWNFRQACAAPATPPVTPTPTPTGPATLTITSFTCFSANGALNRVNFVVGYTNGTFAPALPPLFINGVTDNGMLGQPYNFGFDANASTLAVQDNANRASTYFVWNFRQACAGPVTPPVTPAPTGPATLTITSFNCFSTAGALSSVTFIVGYTNNTFTPVLPPLFINGVTDNGMLGQAYNFSFDANASTLSVQDNTNRASTYFVWNFRQACATRSSARVAAEPVAPLTVQVLGNPSRETVEAEVTGAEGSPLTLQLIDAQGRTIGQRSVGRAGSVERIQFSIGSQPTGILLLRASSPTQIQTVRVLKVD